MLNRMGVGGILCNISDISIVFQSSLLVLIICIVISILTGVGKDDLIIELKKDTSLFYHETVLPQFGHCL